MPGTVDAPPLLPSLVVLVVVVPFAIHILVCAVAALHTMLVRIGRFSLEVRVFSLAKQPRTLARTETASPRRLEIARRRLPRPHVLVRTRQLGG